MIVNKIHLSWRKGRGADRRIIGEIYRFGEMGYNFRYLKDGVEEAKKEGFFNYPEFPAVDNIGYVYSEGIREIFSLRLIPEGRTDRKKYLSFWDADNDNFDWFDELALTQGLLSTDNFEFLGVYNPQKVSSFVTDIAGLTYKELPKGTVAIGDKLTFSIEESAMDYNGKCVKVFYNEKPIGFIKKIHNIYFWEAKEKGYDPTITVKAIDQNGLIKYLFVNVGVEK